MIEEYFVEYRIDSDWSKILRAGPYPDQDTAQEHKRDIAGYQDVVDVVVVVELPMLGEYEIERIVEVARGALSKIHSESFNLFTERLRALRIVR